MLFYDPLLGIGPFLQQQRAISQHMSASGIAANMGGCKCNYKNCNVKSDGKTHMFHYPVFEKIRCHQWLINAHRLDFLDLKVSQLKNRVVCQNHFKDDNFMNFKKDKLTSDAIPTEDGPYCDTSNYIDNTQDSSNLYCITVDDIENDLNGSEKKANFSLKYRDFLTNLDFPPLNNTDEDNISYKHNNNSVDILHDKNTKDKLIDDRTVFYKLSLPEKTSKKVQNQPMLVVPPFVNSKNINQSDNSSNSLKCDKSNVSLSLNFITDSSIGNQNEKKETTQQQSVKKQPKITIISEKKITDPVPITGKLQPVSPNFDLSVPKTKNNMKIKNQKINNIDIIKLKEPSLDETKKIEIEIEPMVKEENKSQPTFSENVVQNNIVVDKSQKTSLLHPRVPPERVEAINKKRKFNMKLREVIESCLDKLENSDKAIPEIVYEPTKDNQPAKSVPDSPVPNNQEYTIRYLEARMTKMENTLLNKIEQNSKTIVDLKNTYKKTTAEKKAKVLTKNDEEAHKKQLFQEISKYLSPSSKSLIYEELFINKFALSESNTTVKRKRGRRVS